MQVLAKHKDLNYIVANAVAAEVAADILAEQGLTEKIGIVSTYINPTVYEKITTHNILAAPSDFTVSQGVMSVDMMVKLFHGERAGIHFPFRAGPLIPVISADNIMNYPYEVLFGKKDYKAVFSQSTPLDAPLEQDDKLQAINTKTTIKTTIKTKDINNNLTIGFANQ